jgi:hypothetical protein
MEQQNESQQNSQSNAEKQKTDTQQQEQPQDKKPQSRESAMRALARELGKANKTDESTEQDKQGEQQQKQQREPLLKTKPKNIGELADALGVDVKELYDLEIPSSVDGEKPYKLGGLKDHMAEREDFTVRSLAFSEKQRKAEAEIVRANAELTEIFNMLPPKAVSPEARELARNRVATQRKIEGARTLNAIPEWRDEKIREADLNEIVEHLSSYGFDEHYLGNIYDHRMFKILRDFTKQSKNLERALALVIESKPKQIAPNKKASSKQDSQRKGMATNSHDAKRGRFLEAFINS